MTSTHKNPDNRTPGTDAMVLAWLAVVAVCDPNRVMTVGCSLLDRVGWVAFGLLRLVLLMGHWQITPFFSEGSRILDILLRIGPCIWCLLHLAAGRA